MKLETEFIETEFIALHFHYIMDVLGLKGESGSEEFVFRLEEAVKNAKKIVNKSHRDGLCYDARLPMARTLVEQKYNETVLIHDPKEGEGAPS